MLYCACAVQADRFMEDYQLGKTYIDPKHVSDGGVTPDHVRRWKVLQELQVSNRTQGNACGRKVALLECFILQTW